jgi:hypothetical protein
MGTVSILVGDDEHFFFIRKFGKGVLDSKH